MEKLQFLEEFRARGEANPNTKDRWYIVAVGAVNLEREKKGNIN